MFENIEANKILKAVFSNPINKDSYKKATLKKVIIKNEEVFQIELFTNTQCFTSNHKDDVKDKLEDLMNYFHQAEIWCSDFYYAFKITSKGKILSNKKKNDLIFNASKNNREKEYIIKEGMIVPPLIDLGVMLDDGRIVKAHYDKYRQINKYLEILDSTIGYEDHLNIIDFGCGKSYLTFIVYYYLKFIKKINCKITGLDLKEDVIDKCNKIKDKYGYNDIEFVHKNIADFKEDNKIDLIMTLHACDTATDFALYHAIRLNVKYILSVPCCQHEINMQLKKDAFNVITKYGLLKERMSAIMTDAIRANILEYYGYKVNVSEFIDFDASPKNVLIKGVLSNNKYNDNTKKEIDKLINDYNLNQTLYNLCFK